MNGGGWKVNGAMNKGCGIGDAIGGRLITEVEDVVDATVVVVFTVDVLTVEMGAVGVGATDGAMSISTSISTSLNATGASELNRLTSEESTFVVETS